MPLRSQLESLLFVASKPIGAKELAELVAAEVPAVEAELEAMMSDYEQADRGLQLIRSNAKYQLVSASKNSELIQKFISDETSGELTRPSLEALTVIAYRGPIAKTELEKIRGVNCSLILKNLLLRGLIEEKPGAGEEKYYTVTLDFVRFLGINKIEELPEYARLNGLELISPALESEAQKILNC